ncbi:MAG: ATP-binding protein [Ignavibacteriae bacterium]|nr:ATP-binding protein [Ignavibacteriota bacterium]
MLVKKSFQQKYKSDPELLPEIEKFILDTIQNEIKISDEKKNSIEISIAEAAANSIIHGNNSDPQKNIFVNLSINQKKIKISFKDEGNGFNPKKIPNPTIPENILKGSGRGLFIMKSLADDVKFNFDKNGTELILTFYL